MECVQPYIRQTELMILLLGTIGVPDCPTLRIFTVSKLKAILEIVIAAGDAGEPAVFGSKSHFASTATVKTTKSTETVARLADADMATESSWKG
jgi:hypothetical protein